MLTTAEQSTLDLTLQSINSLPELSATFLEKPEKGSQGWLSLRGPWGTRKFQVRILPRVSPEGLELIRLQHATGSVPFVLLCGHIGARQHQSLKDQSLPFFDSSGNAWLQSPPLYLDICGRRPPEPLQRPGRAFTTAGLKLIFLLLKNPQAARLNFRELAQQAGISLGGISGIVQELKNQAYLEQKGSRRRDLIRGEALFYRWQLGYLEQLRPKLFLQNCKLNDEGPISQILRSLPPAGQGDNVILGGELGASLLNADGHASQATLHVSSQDVLRLMLQLDLIPDPEGPITLLQTFGEGNRWQGWQPETAPLADPLLLYCELTAQGQGQSPLAEDLLQQHILPRLDEQGTR